MSTSYHFKPLGLPDLPAMMEIERDVFDMPSSASMMRDSLLAAHCQVWGMIDDSQGNLLAFGVLSIILDEVELINISVGKPYHRKGYGETLLNFLLSKSRESKAEQVFLEVPASNSGAIALYEKFGFSQDSLRDGYYENSNGGREDAVIMSLNL